MGTTTTYGAGSYDYWLIKTDASGDTLWTKTFGGSEYDGGLYVQQTNDGGFIITGNVYSLGAGASDVWIIKTDASGDTLWTKVYGGILSDGGLAIRQLSDNGYIVMADTRNRGAGSGDFWLMRTDASGNTLWTRTFGGSDLDNSASFDQTTDNGFILAGRTYSLGTNSYNAWLIKTDATGDTLWTKIFGGSGEERFSDVQQTADEGYIMTGLTQTYGAGLSDLWLIKTDALGDTLWTKTLGGSEKDRGHSVRQIWDGGYIITGYTFSYGHGADDAWLIRLGPEATNIVYENGIHMTDSYQLYQN